MLQPPRSACQSAATFSPMLPSPPHRRPPSRASANHTYEKYGTRRTDSCRSKTHDAAYHLSSSPGLRQLKEALEMNSLRVVFFPAHYPVNASQCADRTPRDIAPAGCQHKYKHVFKMMKTVTHIYSCKKFQRYQRFSFVFL